jgi:hypothetical protein
MSQFTNQSISHYEAKSTQPKLLSDAQEEVPATSQILKNIVVELVRKPVWKKWIRQFCQQYVDRTASGYFRGIDQKHKIADNSVYLQYMYQIVCTFLLFSNSLKEF